MLSVDLFVSTAVWGGSKYLITDAWIKSIRWELMLSLEVCKKILSDGKIKYTNEEIKEIREFVYNCGYLQLEHEEYIKNKELN